jgi:hypothetical protein
LQSFAIAVGQNFVAMRATSGSWLPPLGPRSSLARGVGHVWRPRDDEEPISTLRGADGGSWNAVPPRIVPERGQVSENGSKSASKESCDVLHDDEARSKLANDPCVFAP